MLYVPLIRRTIKYPVGMIQMSQIEEIVQGRRFEQVFLSLEQLKKCNTQQRHETGAISFLHDVIYSYEGRVCICKCGIIFVYPEVFAS